jgi:hypothetical protein
MMPAVRITEVLHDVSRATGFAQAFTNLRTGERCEDENALLAAVLADATNLGLDRMAAASHGVTRDKLIWIADAYIRPETYQAALARIINAHHALPVAATWGDGTTSASDRQFFRSGKRAHRLLRRLPLGPRGRHRGPTPAAQPWARPVGSMSSVRGAFTPSRYLSDNRRYAFYPDAAGGHRSAGRGRAQVQPAAMGVARREGADPAPPGRAALHRRRDPRSHLDRRRKPVRLVVRQATRGRPARCLSSVIG